MQGLPSPIQQEAYRTRFITHCATLLFLGRDRLGATKLSTLEETEITGLMVDAMRQITETDGAEQWMRYHVVVDDPPQSTKGRLGSSRPRIDIEMIEAGRPDKRLT